MRQELTALLHKATQQAPFDCGRLGELTASQLRTRYSSTTGLDYRALPAKPHLPNDLLAELTSLFRLLLAAYVVADKLRFELAYLLGGRPQITVEEFAQRSIRATALLGAERTADMVLGWVEGKPFQYQRNAVISGLRTDQPLEWRGMYFANLTEGALRDHVPIRIVDELGSDNLSRAVKMSVLCELRPALYRLLRQIHRITDCSRGPLCEGWQRRIDVSGCGTWCLAPGV